MWIILFNQHINCTNVWWCTGGEHLQQLRLGSYNFLSVKKILQREIIEENSGLWKEWKREVIQANASSR